MATTITAAPDDPTGSPTRRKNYIYLMMALAIIMVAAATIATIAAQTVSSRVSDLEDQVDRIEENQVAARERTYRSQALTCSIKLAIGASIDDDPACHDPAVLELYDENAGPVITGLMGDGGGG